MKPYVALNLALVLLVGASVAEPGESSQALSTKATVRVSDLLRAVQPPSEGLTRPESMTVRQALGDLFAQTGCPLPKRVRKKIEKMHERGEDPWLPGDLKTSLQDVLKATVESEENQNVRAVLHFVVLGRGAHERRVTLIGAPTYVKFDPQSTLDRNRPRALFTYDCSGVLNLTASLNIDVGWGGLKQAASACLNAQRSFLIAYGSLFSPVAMAIQPEAAPQSLPASSRIGLLYSILAEANMSGATDGTQVKAWREIEVIWTSGKGTSSFQGKADLSGSAGGSFLVFSASGGGSAEGSVKRSVQFEGFKTYVLSEEVAQPVVSDIGKIRSQLVSLVRNAQVVSGTKRVDASYVITLDLPGKVCQQNWRMAALREAPSAVSGSVSAAVVPEGCQFAATPSQGKQVIGAQKGFKIVSGKLFGSDQDLEIAVAVP